jgi:hypothetical protein
LLEFQSPYEKKPDDETPKLPYIGHNRILTTRAFVRQSPLSYGFPASADGIDQIAAAIRVGTSLCHQFPHSYSRLLYQLSYRGT